MIQKVFLTLLLLGTVHSAIGTAVAVSKDLEINVPNMLKMHGTMLIAILLGICYAIGRIWGLL